VPDPSIEPVLQVIAIAADPGGVAPVPMALHGGQCRWLALIIETIKELSVRLVVLEPRRALP